MHAYNVFNLQISALETTMVAAEPLIGSVGTQNHCFGPVETAWRATI